jgi:hypothetical protein
MVAYQFLSAASPTQAKAKPRLWLGFGSQLGLTIIKAKALAFRPSQAGTSLN